MTDEYRDACIHRGYALTNGQISAIKRHAAQYPVRTPHGLKPWTNLGITQGTFQVLLFRCRHGQEPRYWRGL